MVLREDWVCCLSLASSLSRAGVATHMCAHVTYAHMHIVEQDHKDFQGD